MISAKCYDIKIGLDVKTGKLGKEDRPGGHSLFLKGSSSPAKGSLENASAVNVVEKLVVGCNKKQKQLNYNLEYDTLK